MKLEQKIRERLREWVAEDELEAIIDTELNKARAELKSEVAKSIRQETKRLATAWFDEWKQSDEAKAYTKEVAQDLLNKAKEDIISGNEVPEEDRWRNDATLARKVKDSMVAALSSEVDAFVFDWKNSDEATGFREKIAAEIIPKAAGFALAQLAETVLSGKLNKIMHPNLVPAPDQNNTARGFGSNY